MGYGKNYNETPSGVELSVARNVVRDAGCKIRRKDAIVVTVSCKVETPFENLISTLRMFSENYFQLSGCEIEDDDGLGWETRA